MLVRRAASGTQTQPPRFSPRGAPHLAPLRHQPTLGQCTGTEVCLRKCAFWIFPVLGSTPVSVSHQLCDLEEVTEPPRSRSRRPSFVKGLCGLTVIQGEKLHSEPLTQG